MQFGLEKHPHLPIGGHGNCDKALVAEIRLPESGCRLLRGAVEIRRKCSAALAAFGDLERDTPIMGRIAGLLTRKRFDRNWQFAGRGTGAAEAVAISAVG